MLPISLLADIIVIKQVLERIAFFTNSVDITPVLNGSINVISAWPQVISLLQHLMIDLCSMVLVMICGFFFFSLAYDSAQLIIIKQFDSLDPLVNITEYLGALQCFCTYFLASDIIAFAFTDILESDDGFDIHPNHLTIAFLAGAHILVVPLLSKYMIAFPFLADAFFLHEDGAFFGGISTL